MKIAPLHKCSILCYLLILPALSFAGALDGTFLYRGEIENAGEITLELRYEGSSCTGTYVYNRFNKDITLQGTLKDNKLILVEENGATFEGNFDESMKTFEGEWTDKQKHKHHRAVWYQLNDAQNDYAKVKGFNNLLNFFDRKNKMPTSLMSGGKWLNNVSQQSKMLPYDIASLYIMQPVKRLKKNTIDYPYFDITSTRYGQYHMGFCGMGRVQETAEGIVLMLFWYDDSQWDEYKMVFLLSFDHEGNLKDLLRIYSYVLHERTGENSSEKANAVIAGNRIERKFEMIDIRYGTDPQTLKPYYRESNDYEDAVYELRAGYPFKLIKKNQTKN